MDFWWILISIDWILFIGVAFTTLYVTIFSVASLFSKNIHLPKAKRQNRFIVLIPSYKNDRIIAGTVTSILSQTYPQRLFDVSVISDHQSEITNMQLAQYTITLLTPDFEKSAKTKSLQYAMLHLPEFKIYDAVVILNAGDIVEPEFLEQINAAYEMAGTKALVVHKLPRNRDTSAARLSTIFDEASNSIFRRGHITLGFSSALQGSGVAYEFDWFKRNIMNAHGATEDKELEAFLVSQRIFVDYFDNIYVYNEKKREVADFNRQRGRWITDQIVNLLRNIRFLPSAIFNRQYDWIDKIIQWMLIPRSIMFAIIFLMCIILPFIYFTIAIKWWVIAFIWGLSLALATPNELVDKNWDYDFIMLPVSTLINIFKRIFSFFKK
jgi:cellulose synthase/poly-beta-1,6-N-acetylglucosamine synthase-like glycosyltransferase